MNNTINLESHTIDLSTLEELRDPNLISRYPPLFQRKQNLITLDHNCNINSSSGSIKRSKTVSTTNSKNASLAPSISAPISNYYQIQPYSPSLASKEAPSNYGNKRHRFVKFLKNFSTKSSRPTRSELLKQSISKPIAHQSPVPTETLDHHASIFMNSLYPTKSRNSIEIKSDEDTETMCDARGGEGGGGGGGRIGAVKVEDETEEYYEETKEFDLSRRNTYLSQLKFQPMSPPQDFSAVNTIIVPPVGGSSQIINPEHYSSPIIHPNIHLDESGGTMGSNHRTNISFAKYDLMNLDPSAMSPVDDHDGDDDDDDDDDDDMVEIDRTEFVLPNSSFFIPTTTINNASRGETVNEEGGAGAEEDDDDDNDSYYSFSKSPQDSNKLSIKSPAMRSNSSRIVASPIYRIIHNSPTEGRYY